jgi:Ni/Fe-hydrogenase subunit HybB-like protein
MAEGRVVGDRRFRAPARSSAGHNPPFTISRVLALGVAVALAIDAYVHATSAGFYDPVQGGLITEGNLFRAEVLVSGAVALLLLLRPSRWTLTAALLVAASALAAVVLYRYVDVGPIGPIPDLYEPTWAAPGKLLSAFAEGFAVLLSTVGIVLARARRHRR